MTDWSFRLSVRREPGAVRAEEAPQQAAQGAPEGGAGAAGETREAGEAPEQAAARRGARRAPAGRAHPRQAGQGKSENN